MTTPDNGTNQPGPLEDLPSYCTPEFLTAHLAREKREDMFLPMMFGIHVTDEDAARIDRAYDLLRSQGQGKAERPGHGVQQHNPAHEQTRPSGTASSTIGAAFRQNDCRNVLTNIRCPQHDRIHAKP